MPYGDFLNRQEHLHRRIAALFRASEPRLERILNSFVRRLEQAIADGEPVSPWWVQQEARYRALLEMARREAEANIARAEELAKAAMPDALASGHEDAQELVRDAVRTANLRASVWPAPEQELAILVRDWDHPERGAGAYFRRVLPEHAQALEKLIFQGLLEGKGALDVAARLRRELKLPQVRCQAIARTESLRVYRESRRATYVANAHVVKGWRWSAAKSERTCMVCVALDGKVFPLEQPMQEHPLGRCSARPVVEGVPARQTGAEWFGKQPPEMQAKILCGVLSSGEPIYGARYHLYRQRKITLDDCIDLSPEHPQFGRHYTPKALRKMVREQIITEGDLVAASKMRGPEGLG